MMSNHGYNNILTIVKDLENTIVELTKKNDNLQQANNGLQHRIVELTKDQSAHMQIDQHAIDSLRHNNDAMKKTIVDLHRPNRTHIANIRVFERGSARLADHLAKCKLEIEDIRNEMGNINDEILRLRYQIRNMEYDKKLEKENNLKNVGFLNEAIYSLIEKIDAMTTEIVKAQDHLSGSLKDARR